MTKFSFCTCKRNAKEKPNEGKKCRRRHACACVVNVIIVIMVAFGTSAFFLRHYYTNSHSDNFHKGDQLSMRHISADDFSTRMCAKYHVQSVTPADIYLLRSKAEVDKDHKKIVRKQLINGSFYAGSDYNYDGFYLLKHSEISIEACRIPNEGDVEVDVLIFKGRKSWKKWQKKQWKSKKHAEKILPLTITDTCSKGKIKMNYKVHHSDSYYVAVARKNKAYVYKRAKLYVDLLLERTTYKLEHVKEFCPHTSSCTLNLTFSSDEDVVMEIQDNTFSRQAFFSTHCRLRFKFWVGIFAILPLSIILFVIGCSCCCLALARKRQRCQKQQACQKMMTYQKTMFQTKLPINYNDKAILVINEELPEKKLPLPEDQLPSYESVVDTKLQAV